MLDEGPAMSGTNSRQTHPTSSELRAFVLGRLRPPAQAIVERHVATCAVCCQALHQVPDDALLQRLREARTPPTAANRGPTAASELDLGPAPDVPPELLQHPRYHIVRRLGRGGMGAVYQAVHRFMERHVALKIIRRELTRDPRVVERFQLEVKTAARLSHPNIVVAHDAEQAGDLHFLVMELIDGASLARLVELGGPLPVTQACEYIRQAALGLEHAFEQGLVHRDIKPQNLMVTRAGQVKVLDFGLARLAEQQRNAGQLTAHGTVLGTPDYIAPEQARDAHRADIRSDVYSLGCTLYFLLAGQPPFPEGSAMEKLLSHTERQPPPLKGKRRDVPPELIAVLEHMMAKEPAQRYQTPAEVAQALAPLAKGAAGEATLVPRAEVLATPARSSRSRSRLVLAAAGALFVAVAAVLAVALLPRSGQPVSTAGSGGIADPHPWRALLVVPHKTFSFAEFEGVQHGLKGPAVVKVASTRITDAVPRSAPGAAPVTPDLALGDARAEDFDAVVFFGGPDMTDLLRDPPGRRHTHDLIVAMRSAQPKKYLGAVGAGTNVLADAGVLNGLSAAKNGDIRGPFQEGANILWLEDEVVVSDRILTARDGNYAELFARKLLGQLARGD
jgi:putative intracellular protease/amidase/tRNA A-37 threonylcarbamoyl transferase component Bud32